MRKVPFGLVAASLFSLAPAVASAAIVKGPWVHRVTPTSAVVRFELDAPAPAAVQLGVGAARAVKRPDTAFRMEDGQKYTNLRPRRAIDPETPAD